MKRLALQILLAIAGLLMLFRFGGPALIFGATGPGPLGNRWLEEGTSATCPHRGGPLGEGALAGEVVTCPWHGATFNVKTGEVLGPPARQGVRSFPVKVQGNDALVELD